MPAVGDVEPVSDGRVEFSIDGWTSDLSWAEHIEWGDCPPEHDALVATWLADIQDKDAPPDTITYICDGACPICKLVPSIKTHRTSSWAQRVHREAGW